MTEELKNYIIVGDNNYWYSSLKQVTKQELQDEIDKIKNDIIEFGFDESIETEPNKLYIHETINDYSVSVE